MNTIIFGTFFLLSAITFTAVTSNSKNFLGGAFSKIWIVAAGILPIILTILIFSVLYLFYMQEYLYGIIIALSAALTFYYVSENIWTQNIITRIDQNFLTSPPLKMTTLNLLYNNPDKGMQISEELSDLDSDILFLVEYAPALYENLQPLTETYSNILLPETEYDMPDVAIFSKYELYNTRTEFFEDRPILLAEINYKNTIITIACIHTVSPVNSKRARKWVGEFEKFTQIFTKIKTPLIIAGDFNASIGHKPYRDFIKKADLKDVTLGVNTWSNKKWIPSWMHLDHILTSKQFNKHADTLVGKGYGSDHKPVTVILTIV